MSDPPLVAAEGVSKKFCRELKRSLIYACVDMGRELTGKAPEPVLRSREFWALRDVSFSVRRGEALGIIGPNGAGKSTLLKILSGIIKPTTGHVTLRGRSQALIELGSGMSSVLTGRENIYVNAAVLGIPKAVVEERFDEIVAFAELEEFLDTPVRNYSSGMKVRLGFAIAIHVEPDILIIDEVLAVGDQRFRQKARNAMQRLLDRDVAVIFISHNMHEVMGITRRALWLDKGHIVMTGESAAVCRAYVHDSMTRDRGPRELRRMDKRAGTLEVVDVQVDDAADGIVRVGDDHRAITARLTLQARADIDEPIFHVLSLVSPALGPAAYVTLTEGSVKLAPGQTREYALRLDLSHVHPGDYELAYEIGTHGGPRLDAVENLLEIEVRGTVYAPDRGGFPAMGARMMDNARGGGLLAARMDRRDA